MCMAGCRLYNKTIRNAILCGTTVSTLPWLSVLTVYDKEHFFLFFINDISAREGEYKQTGTDKNVDFKFLLDFIETDQKK